MAQAYSNPKRASDLYALPDVEVFYHDCTDTEEPCEFQDPELAEYECVGPGFYWWFCFPGCLPDGDPMGPFATEAEALADAQSGMED